MPVTVRLLWGLRRGGSEEPPLRFEEPPERAYAKQTQAWPAIRPQLALTNTDRVGTPQALRACSCPASSEWRSDSNRRPRLYKTA